MMRTTLLLGLTAYLLGCASLTGVKPTPRVNAEIPPRAGDIKAKTSVVKVKLTLKQVNGQFSPSTEVILTVMRDKPEHHLLANVRAICSQYLKDVNTLAEVRCWHAGAGQNFAVRRQDNALLVSRIDVSEEGPETQAQVIRRIPLSPNETVQSVK
ncbi:MAG: hypothetical protein ACPGQS_01505 [Bradymonadia bacterium]